MSQEPVTVTYSLEEVLTRLEQKIDKKFEQLEQKVDNLQQDVSDLKVGQAKLTEKVEGIDNRLKVVEGTQKNQVWTLIGILFTAVTGFLLAVGRFVIAGNP